MIENMKDKYLQMVLKVPNITKPGLNEVSIAEMLHLKESSLWYSQVEGWIDNPPNIVSEKTKLIFQQESKLFIEACNNNYKIPEKYNQNAALFILDFIDLTEQLRKNSMMIISTWIPIVAKIILHNSKVKNQIVTEPTMKKCLNPDCDKQIDISKKKSGACSVEHTRYYCKECKHWHHYGTKVANEHYQYKITDWIKDKNKREEIIKGGI